MSVSTIEGFIENGQIRVPESVKLPNGAKVYIVIPDLDELREPIHIYSPRLANRELAKDFHMEVVKEPHTK